MFRPVLLLARRLGLRAGRCPVCGTVMEDRTTLLCPACARDLPRRTGGFCPACGEMSGRETDPPSLCTACRREPPPWDRLHFHGRYENRLRELILGYKFNNRFDRSRLLAALGAAAFAAGDGPMPDGVVPVPLHNRRLAWRGFNQSLEIARGVARQIDRPLILHGLKRTRNTPPQTGFGLRDRQANIKDAFSADPKRISGGRMLLVDDVYTTGATLRECARTLRRAGCSGVDVLVLARTAME